MLDEVPTLLGSREVLDAGIFILMLKRALNQSFIFVKGGGKGDGL